MVTFFQVIGLVTAFSALHYTGKTWYTAYINFCCCFTSFISTAIDLDLYVYVWGYKTKSSMLHNSEKNGTKLKIWESSFGFQKYSQNKY